MFKVLRENLDCTAVIQFLFTLLRSQFDGRVVTGNGSATGWFVRTGGCIYSFQHVEVEVGQHGRAQPQRKRVEHSLVLRRQRRGHLVARHCSTGVARGMMMGRKGRTSFAVGVIFVRLCVMLFVHVRQLHMCVVRGIVVVMAVRRAVLLVVPFLFLFIVIILMLGGAVRGIFVLGQLLATAFALREGADRHRLALCDCAQRRHWRSRRRFLTVISFQIKTFFSCPRSSSGLLREWDRCPLHHEHLKICGHFLHRVLNRSFIIALTCATYLAPTAARPAFLLVLILPCELALLFELFLKLLFHFSGQWLSVGAQLGCISRRRSRLSSASFGRFDFVSFLFLLRGGAATATHFVCNDRSDEVDVGFSTPGRDQNVFGF
mmetsp:Transcript_3047/g.5067  ORF Transcript_3047/g.5067 Transcript_3047/m.5067 type:complete len:376 (-) Transcript_3047:862-1989(-)